MHVGDGGNLDVDVFPAVVDMALAAVMRYASEAAKAMPAPWVEWAKGHDRLVPRAARRRSHMCTYRCEAGQAQLQK